MATVHIQAISNNTVVRFDIIASIIDVIFNARIISPQISD